MEVQIVKDLTAKLEGGILSLNLDVKALIVPALLAERAKIESGEVDLVKGTDLDKTAILLAIDAVVAQVSK